MKRLGVIGSLVWDRIHLVGEGQPIETWGGIAYSLAALSASCTPPWQVVPILKVGDDLAPAAFRLLREMPHISIAETVRRVPEQNNRVELRYRDAERRCERLTGGVPPWSWEDLGLQIGGLDALYVNFISGFELDLATACRLRECFDGPIYADLHSLLLGRAADGRRTYRLLERAADWLQCFDAIQLNQDELRILAGSLGDIPPHLSELLKFGPALVAETRGADGAHLARSPGLPADPLAWPQRRGAGAAPRLTGVCDRESIAAAAPPPGDPTGGAADPTGCGDVWGATFYAYLLAGNDFDRAAEAAGRAAARNLVSRGASGLHTHLASADEVARG